MDLRQIIENFNNGDWEYVSPIFNRKITTFLIFLNAKNLLDRIDINQIPEDEFPEMDFLDSLGILDNLEYRSVPDWASNKFLLYKLEKTPTETLAFICDDLLSDVELRGEDYYLRLVDREELSQFFKDYGRSTSPRDVAKSVLAEDEIFEPYWDTTNDVYSDVIEVLNKENLEVISHYIIERIGNQVLSIDDYETEFFDNISNESGEFTITTENINELLRDEESMKLLLNDDLNDLKHELYSLHNNSYNSAYENEVYGDVMSELERLFVGNIIEEQSTKNDRTYHTPYIKIRDFYNDVNRFLNTFEGSGYNEDNLEYHGSYTEMIKHLMDDGEMEFLDFRIPDYPDHREVEKNINDMLSDYI
jgi:hypothetical protein